MKLLFFALFYFAISYSTFSQTTELRQKIQGIVATKKAKVGIAITGPSKADTLSFYGNGHFPMQSVFKLHIALAMLAEVDKGKYRLEQKINVGKEDLLPDFYSPLRDAYPKGGDIKLSKILDYTIADSDNVGCELLLKLLGGPQAIEKYFISKGFTGVSIKINEQVMQKNWDLQFQNWTTPKAANEVLAAYYFNSKKLLSKQSHDFLWTVMKNTRTGKNRLRGQLPTATILAHKTGSSGTNKEGLTAAVNDIGILFLPNGQPIFISVFVTESRENEATNEKIIADIGKATWDYFIRKKK
jgi:beta-lactamase class A/beta-lactamase class A VEB